ncbi:hypothetical protein BU24DRAFT_177921 [Aaosphaeria arxii CBS 175.79]|uniref:Uncharacterized protein n=1 Tax=Aaosphaeria arxii CBS 175.79 TaxID=1450172 RepID=A0A6A5XR88_9PLEO|nr:uncharacterized protein BU24DRAFT_177921 [Aaosphaeria arxii CBS 175.79]KAF2015419.1 hypothetical protein BU24DRAFT_177921 [Aaosphaeria arxii CBS 175.79]
MGALLLNLLFSDCWGSSCWLFILVFWRSFTTTNNGNLVGGLTKVKGRVHGIRSDSCLNKSF